MILSKLKLKPNPYIVSWIGCGIATGIILYLKLEFTGILIIIIICLLVSILPLLGRLKLMVLGIIFGISRMYLQTIWLDYNNPRISYGTVHINGKIIARRGTRYTIELNALSNANGTTYKVETYKVIISSNEDLPLLGNIDAYIQISRAPFEPIPGSVNLRYKAFFRKVLGYGKLITYTIHDVPSSNALRQYIYNKIRLNFSEPYQSLIATILLGISNNLDKTIVEHFQNLGITHLLAISGLHFSLFGGVFYIIGRWLIGPFISLPMQYTGTLLSLFGITLYLCIAEPSWSVIRSAIMAFTLPICMLFNRTITAMRSVFLAFALILLIDPSALLDLGFQLSFIAVFTLLNAKNKLFIITILVSITTAPYILHSFGRISLEPFISSIICMQLFSFIIMPLLVITAFTTFPSFLVQLTTFSLKYFLMIVDTMQYWLTTKVYLRLTSIGLCIWSAGLAIWLLLQIPSLAAIICACSFLFIRPRHLSIVISKDGRDIVFIVSDIVFAKNIDSYHSTACLELFGAKYILPIPNQFKLDDHTYCFKNTMLHLTRDENRFVKATYKSKQILTRWDMKVNKSAAIIAFHKNQVKIMWT